MKTANMLRTIFFITLGIVSSCKKLDIIPDSSMVTPQTMEHYQGLLDNPTQIYQNRSFLSLTGCDDFYIPGSLDNFSTIYKLSYVWAKDPFQKETVTDWDLTYKTVFSCNTVLEGVDRLINERETPNGKNIRGQAYFHRANAHWQVAQLFCKPYNGSTALTDPGIPLRLSSNYTQLVPRASVEQTYRQIINDLLEAEKLLPATAPVKTRPAQNAATAMLARVYLSMSKYEKALEYANKSLLQYSTLMNYNFIENSTFKQYNEETIWFSTINGSTLLNTDTYCPVDTVLFASYDKYDLRRTLYFTAKNNLMVFKGNYSGNAITKFCGLATDELYLIKAECLARLNSISDAMNALNTLMVTRWKNNGSWQNYIASTQEEALYKILQERRKELVYRGQRWTDLRRLNLNGAAIYLKRIVNGDTITLEPNSPRYVHLIPEQELELNPMEQNKR